MKLNEGLTISSKLPVSRPSANQDAVSRGRCSTSMPILRHEHAEVDVRDSDVAVFQNRFESVGVTGLGQEAFGLGAILLHVLSEARKFLKLGVRHRPLRSRTHQPADVLEARDGVEHATRGVPIETERQRLPSRPTKPWSCVSTKRLRFRRSTGASPSCPCVPAMSSGGSTITRGTARRRCLRRPTPCDGSRATRRFHLHFTPTGASWINLVERWFTALTEK